MRREFLREERLFSLVVALVPAAVAIPWRGHLWAALGIAGTVAVLLDHLRGM
ncbi:MAG TPA: hypothetical protein VGS20_07505 [Candidatus Acidoferrales bacterium]|nr:hypothetical protein [Candidatus Acidoferrales bacterium]